MRTSFQICILSLAAVTMTFCVSTYAVQGQCPADLNGDGQINQADVAQLLVSSGSVPFPPVPAWATLLEVTPDPTVVTDANLRAAIVASGFAWRVRDNAANIEMLLVPAGTFMMGCSPGDAECLGDESPTHQVTLTQAFYMGKTEVTQAQWLAVMGSNPSYFSSAYGYPGSFDRPVEYISWDEIQGFNSATGLRLPTEAEWEYACRATTTTTRYGVLNDIAWHPQNWTDYSTQPVATKLPNAFGLYDTIGNVHEWCQDWYSSTYYSSSPLTNPTGPTTGSSRLWRGGSFDYYTFLCRASQRLNAAPSAVYRQAGFRVVRDTVSLLSPTSGSMLGGTAITITGANLTGASSVTVGGVPATNVVAVNSTTVTAVTPAGSVGAASVEVTGAEGTATATNAFTYIFDVVPAWATLLEFAPDPTVVTDAKLRAAIMASGFAWRIKDTSSDIEMLLVPAGTFTMGCSRSTQYGCDSEESPTHEVTLTQAFYMGRYEVTQAQWQAKMGSNPSRFGGQPNNPVEQVSWNMIASGSTSFMSLTGLRLPTEAEWEYAYRAGTSTAFHSYLAQPNGFDDETLLGNIAWFNGNSGDQTHAVGGKLANGLGLHDMAGNVFEWCQDWFSSTYYDSSPLTNPTGPTPATYRLLRGGSWFSGSDYCLGGHRYFSFPNNADVFIGFRVVRTP